MGLGLNSPGVRLGQIRTALESGWGKIRTALEPDRGADLNSPEV